MANKKRSSWPCSGTLGFATPRLVMTSPLPLLGTEAPKPLVGIARLAAQGEFIQPGHDVEYFTLPARSLLNRCTAARMPFTWTINPYRGCEFACKYCYARYTHEFMELRDGVDFERKIYAKQNAGWLLRRDLKKVKRGEEIAIGTATDPYQPAERRYEVTRAIMEELAQHSGLSLGIVTKSTLVLRDTALLQQIAERNQIFVNLTVTTLDPQLARLLEPRAPRPDLRLDVIRKLNQAGVPAGAICAPVVPVITDSPQQLDALVGAIKQPGGHYISANPLVLKQYTALRGRYEDPGGWSNGIRWAASRNSIARWPARCPRVGSWRSKPPQSACPREAWHRDRCRRPDRCGVACERLFRHGRRDHH